MAKAGSTKAAAKGRADTAKKAGAGKTAGKQVKAEKKELAGSYNAHKFFEGQQYTGMKIGRSHSWHYDKGEWKEKKITPDLWEISYAVTKRRAGKAPEGSGVPVGTEYHWYILAHQHVRKLNANDYTTELTGLKFKLAHKRYDSEKWNTGVRAQRSRLVKLLEEMIASLEKDAVPIDIEYKGKRYLGEAIPVAPVCDNGVCYELDITLNEKHVGLIHCTDKGWRMSGIKDQGLVNAIGEEIFLWYQ